MGQLSVHEIAQIAPLAILPELVCPHDGHALVQEGRVLCCPRGHRFPIVQGVPVLLREGESETIGLAGISLRAAWADVEGRNDDLLFIDTLGISDEEKKGVLRDSKQKGGTVDPVVSYLIAATNGSLYRGMIGSLKEYPIPSIGLPSGTGKRLIDVGCGWGRWSLAAAARDYSPIGVDPSLGAVLAAARIAKAHGVPFHGVVADARFLPFRSGNFDAAFSYSVLQHFSKPDARAALAEMRRVLRSGGDVLVQMASALGARSFQQQVRRRFREPRGFEVRYWTPGELLRTFRDTFGPTAMEVDCYFGLGLQASDVRLMDPARRAVIYGSEALKRIAKLFPPFKYLADSLYLRSVVGRGAARAGATMQA